jgi:cyclohexanecarboxylate-CoA ligase
LGEPVCAVVVPKAGQTLDFTEMAAFLKCHKLAVRYIPERLILRDATSRKIQKFGSATC